MVPILLSIAGALAGKAVVSAVEWMTEDKPAESAAVVKSDIKGTGFSQEATKVSISPEALQHVLFLQDQIRPMANGFHIARKIIQSFHRLRCLLGNTWCLLETVSFFITFFRICLFLITSHNRCVFLFPFQKQFFLFLQKL